MEKSNSWSGGLGLRKAKEKEGFPKTTFSWSFASAFEAFSQIQVQCYLFIFFSLIQLGFLNSMNVVFYSVCQFFLFDRLCLHLEFKFGQSAFQFILALVGWTVTQFKHSNPILGLMDVCKFWILYFRKITQT